jgi:hypothetical protein
MFLSYMYGISSSTSIYEHFNADQIMNETLRDSFQGVEKETLDKDDKYHFMLWQIGAFEAQIPCPCSKSLWNRLRYFLVTNQDYNPTTVITQLVSRGFIGLAIEVANGRGSSDNVLMNKCLYYIIQKGFTELSERVMQFMYAYQYIDLVIRSGEGILLRSVQPSLQIRYMLHYIRNLREKRIERMSKIDVSDSDRDDDEYDIDAPKVLSPKPYYGYTPTVWKGRFGYFDDDDLRKFHVRIALSLCDLLPFVRDEDTLQEVAAFFSPEKTFDSNSKQMSGSEYYYPYIHVQSHIELYICSLLELYRLRRDSSISNFVHDKKILSTQMQDKMEENLRKYADKAPCTYRRNFLISKCLKYGNKSAAAVIYETINRWNDALCCHLSLIRESIHHSTESTSHQHVLALLDRYVISRTDRSIEQDSILLCKIFRFWEDSKFPIEPLEEHLIRQMHAIGECLSHLLLTWESDCPPFVIGLSHKFYLKLSQTFVTSLKKFEHDESRSNRALQSQIMRNMEKDLNERPFITVNAHEVGDSVVFSCGHRFDRTKFFESVIPEFRRRMQQLTGDFKSNSPKAPIEDQIRDSITEQGNSSTFINTIVTKTIEADYDLIRSHRINQACPICVHNFILKMAPISRDMPDMWHLD